MATYKEIADKYAKRVARCRNLVERHHELERIRAEIDRLTVDGKAISEQQIVQLLRELKKSLRELGFDESIISFETYINEEFSKSSSSISNDELLSLMRMVAKGRSHDK
ncbi:TPA: hypothetical protein ACXEP4_000110 [Klebsiella pneumoniae]|uniref:hypothetical protein n=1 Tax=Enterobacteriaceae TaxID=543 RepID=UPI001B9E6F73|nr:hypothetical protein [Enterobacter huaxiensis]MCF0982411.1 hypothetical protein [Klebsiella pneumoniae]HBC9086179.1 hypothetical protein [Citrobacter koseri]HDS5328172.1 hypothetical protein [Klebsiella pneumoniae]